jgi:uncharacterized membrane protein YfcA
MSKIMLAGKHAMLFGLRRRRIRVWAIIVIAAVIVLGTQAAIPEWRLWPIVSDRIRPAVMLCVFLTAMACEYIDSTLGMGYGTTLTPLLLLAGFDPLQVVPCVLLSEAVTGLGAGVMHHRDGNADFLRDRRTRSTTILLSALSAVGAVAAVTLALRVPKFWLKAIIAVIVLSVGLITLATFRRRLAYRPGHLVALGAVAAFNKGLSGGGYGPLVTAGQVVSGMSPKQAVAITSVAESWTCVIGLAAYVVLHGGLDWSLATPLTLGATLSVPIATLTVRHMREAALRCSVGIVTCTLGMAALAQVLW